MKAGEVLFDGHIREKRHGRVITEKVVVETAPIRSEQSIRTLSILPEIVPFPPPGLPKISTI